MRPLPIAAALFAVVLVVGIGLRSVLHDAPSAGPGPATEEPAGDVGPRYLGGVPQGHVYTGFADEPNDVNPYTSNGPVSKRLVIAYTHDSLLDIDPVSGALRPALAESHEVAADGGSCVFTLREGVRFADGSALAMEDVLFGYELYQAKHLTMGFVADAYARVERVEVVDPRRLRVHFRGVHYAATRIVGEAWSVGQKRFFVERVRTMLEPGEAMAEIGSARFASLLHRIDHECGPGTGPYELRNPPGGSGAWRRRQDLLLVRNEHCWRRQVAPGTWNFAGVRQLWRDGAGGQNALLLGEIDWYLGGNGEALQAQYPNLERDYQRLVYDYDSLGVFRCVWNCERPPFDDLRVRKAVGMLFDRTEIARILGSGAKPAVAHAKPGRPEYPDLLPLPFDPAAARRLLREAGFDPAAGKPLHMVLIAMEGSEAHRRMVESFTAAAETAGIELEIRGREMAGFVAEKKKREWHGLLVQQTFRPWGDPYDFLHGDGRDNEGRWRHPEADRLASAARAELDASKRAQLWRQLHTLVHEQQPVALLAHPMASILLAKRVRALEPGPAGLIPERAWVAPADQRR
jgi:dipeptide transport system substrate-binding protein